MQLEVVQSLMLLEVFVSMKALHLKKIKIYRYTPK